MCARRSPAPLPKVKGQRRILATFILQRARGDGYLGASNIEQQLGNFLRYPKKDQGGGGDGYGRTAQTSQPSNCLRCSEAAPGGKKENGRQLSVESSRRSGAALSEKDPLPEIRESTRSRVGGKRTATPKEKKKKKKKKKEAGSKKTNPKENRKRKRKTKNKKKRKKKKKPRKTEPPGEKVRGLYTQLPKRPEWHTKNPR